MPKTLKKPFKQKQSGEVKPLPGICTYLRTEQAFHGLYVGNNQTTFDQWKQLNVCLILIDHF